MSDDKQERNAGVQQHQHKPVGPDELTKRNQDYLYHLKKALVETKLTPEKQQAAIDDMIPKMLAGQKQGQTARQLFGTVTEQVVAIIQGPKTDPNASQNKWLLMLDSSLMVFMVFNLMYGIMFFFSNNSKIQTGQAGILSELILAIVAGFGIMQMQLNMGNCGQKRMPIWRLLVYGVIFFIVLTGTYTLVMLIPGPLNANLPAAVYIVIGAAALVLRIYLKKRFNIKNTVF
ncbi:DUF1129 domain-containing protein [Loigolactobacillus zhaoyuanensis]|uniref:DUF1129 domain-containing protein n=1 Tax=Loigolactobacillus zhaoyuanensis TaxID=2486017 RepID=UPI000F7361CF|nr:DUF1129 domain-containing protein [Loigolactobacillus zhaoyuanensis]